MPRNRKLKRPNVKSKKKTRRGNRKNKRERMEFERRKKRRTGWRYVQTAVIITCLAPLWNVGLWLGFQAMGIISNYAMTQALLTVKEVAKHYATL